MPDPTPESLVAALTADNARLAAEAASARVHVAALQADLDLAHSQLGDASAATRNMRAQLADRDAQIESLTAQLAAALAPSNNPTPEGVSP